jgi:hypothetical protein
VVLCSWSLCARRRCCECGHVWYGLWADTCCQPTPMGSSVILSVLGSVARLSGLRVAFAVVVRMRAAACTGGCLFPVTSR